MKIFRNILIVLLVLVLASGGFLYVRSRPFLQAYQELSTADSFDYRIRLHIDTAASENSETVGSGTEEESAGSFLLDMMENDWVELEGEYVDQTLHGSCSSGSYEDSILEFYRDAEGETTINLTPVIKCMISRLTAENAIVSWLTGMAADQLTDLVITDTQWEKVTGQDPVPDTPELPTLSTQEILLASLISKKNVQSSWFDAGELEGKRFITLTSGDGDSMTIGAGSISSEDVNDVRKDYLQLYVAGSVGGYPCEAMIDLTFPSDTESITIPENHITEEQLELFRSIYEAIEEYGK